MSASSQNVSINSSVSSQMDSHENPEVYRMKTYVRDKLKSRIFLGRYVERRLADKRIGYRDVVLISAAETELQKDLLEAQLKLRTIAPNIHWIGITETAALGYTPGICIWTEIDNQPFGPFWFQIKSLKFREDEIIITVKCLRHISESFMEIEPILMGVKKSKESTEKKLENSVASLNETYTDIIGTLKTSLSISNVKDFFTFLFAFVIAIFTGSTSFVNFLGNFVLALVREISMLVKNSTPMVLGLLDFVSKIIGGFYILLAMLFKPSTPVSYDKRSMAYNERTRRSHHQYDGQFD